jgi:hypothetical protein
MTRTVFDFRPKLSSLSSLILHEFESLAQARCSNFSLLEVLLTTAAFWDMPVEDSAIAGWSTVELAESDCRT